MASVLSGVDWNDITGCGSAIEAEAMIGAGRSLGTAEAVITGNGAGSAEAITTGAVTAAFVALVVAKAVAVDVLDTTGAAGVAMAMATGFSSGSGCQLRPRFS